jgi:excisionase family DNA binding protein
MKAKRSVQGLSTAQVARILGVTKKTLYRMLSDGRIAEPPRNPGNNYRVWAPQYVESVREEIGR